MATVEKVVIEISADTKGVDQATQSIDKLTASDKKAANQFKKTQKDFETAAKKREKLIKEEEQDLKELQARRKSAYSVKGIESYNQRISETQKRIKILRGETQKMQGSFTKLNKTLGTLGLAISGAFAVQQIISFSKEAVKLAAQAEGIEKAFSKLRNSERLLQDLKKATRGTVSELELMQRAVKANNFKIPLEQLATLFEFATKRSIETGESVDDLVDRMVRGIGTKSSRVLDDLGISLIDIQKELLVTADYAEAIGNIASRELAKMGEVEDTTAVALARLNALAQNFIKEGGDQLIKWGTGFAYILGLIDDGFNEVSASQERARDNAREYVAWIKENVEEGERLNFVVSEMVEAQNKLNEANERLVQINNELNSEEISEGRRNLLKTEQKNLEMTASKYRALAEGLKAFYDQLNISDSVRARTLQQIEAELKINQEALKELDIASEDYIETLRTINRLEEERERALNLLVDAQNRAARAQRAALNAGVDGVGARPYAEITQDDLGELSKQVDTANDIIKQGYEEIARIQEQFAEQEKERREATQEVIIDSVLNLNDIINGLNQQQTDRYIQNLRDQLDAGDITREEFERKRKEALEKQAEDDKQAAVFQSIVNTLVAVTKALAISPASSDSSGAIGALQTALISAQPIPQFAKGGMVDGKSHKQGGEIIEAEGGEFILNKKATKAFNEHQLKMLNMGVLPMSKSIKAGQANGRGLAENIAESIRYNGFDDYHMIKAIKETNKTEMEAARYIVSQLKTKRKSRGTQ